MTTTVSTDRDVPTSTTPAGTAEASGYDVVEVISEEKMKELMAKKNKKQEAAGKEKKEKDIADMEVQQNGAEKNAAKLVARQDMDFDGEVSTVGRLTKKASATAVTSPTFGTTLVTLKLPFPSTYTITTAQAAYPGRKAGSEGPEAEMVDSAARTTENARLSLPCITLRSQGAHSTICPHSSCWNGDC